MSPKNAPQSSAFHQIFTTKSGALLIFRNPKLNHYPTTEIFFNTNFENCRSFVRIFFFYFSVHVTGASGTSASPPVRAVENFRCQPRTSGVRISIPGGFEPSDHVAASQLISATSSAFRPCKICPGVVIPAKMRSAIRYLLQDALTITTRNMKTGQNLEGIRYPRRRTGEVTA